MIIFIDKSDNEDDKKEPEKNKFEGEDELDPEELNRQKKEAIKK